MSLGTTTRVRGAVLAAVLFAAGTLPVEGQSWRKLTQTRQVDGERELDVRVSYGAGELRVRPAERGLLYRMQLRYDEEAFEPRAEYRDGRLQVGVKGIGKNIRLGKDRSGGEMELELARGVPIDLDLEFGAVRADVDVGGLSLTDLALRTGASEARFDVSAPNPQPMRRASIEVGAADFTARHLGNLNAERIEVSAGVGEVTLEMTGDWRRDAHLAVSMGLGSLELRFPRGLGVRLEKSSFLTSLDPEGLVKRGDYYYSPDWEEADRRVTVGIDAAFGSVKIVWVR